MLKCTSFNQLHTDVKTSLIFYQILLNNASSLTSRSVGYRKNKLSKFSCYFSAMFFHGVQCTSKESGDNYHRTWM